MTDSKFTPGPWVAHGAFYPHGTIGDVFANDARNVRDATPICRVVQPVSKCSSDAKGRPIDALHAIAKCNAQAPIIEANARLISAAPDLLEACLAAQEASDLSDACKDMDSIPKHIMDNAAQLFNRARSLRAAAIAKARGEVA